MKKLVTTFLFFFFLLFALQAQTRQIKGTVTNAETGNPVANVIISVKGTDKFTETDSEGNYMLMIPSELTTIQFKDIPGTKIKEVVVAGSHIYNIVVSSELADMFDLSLAELMNMEVVSASNTKENLSDAPAKIVVITRQEIEERGYTDYIQMFDDLPGIDLSMTYGDLYAKKYWRGVRKGIPSPFLLMIDGMVMNHLWYNWTELMTAIPLSMVKQVEIVYGPASSVYGPNASMGVFNIITTKDFEENGAKGNVKVSTGNFDNKIIDATYYMKKDDFRMRFTGYFNHGDIDKEPLENYEWTKSKYAQDRSLWGSFLDNSAIAGEISSPRNNRALLANTYYKNTEFGIHYFVAENGYGFNYAYDKIQPLSKWAMPELNIFLRNNHSFNDNVSTSTLIRYRESDVSNESNTLEDISGADRIRYISFAYWQSLCRSWSANQDFDIKLGEKLQIKTGLKFEYKDLQKAYDLPRGSSVLPADADVDNYDYPDAPVRTYRSENRVIWIDQGIYVQGKYSLGSSKKHFLNVGLRLDDNSFYGSNFMVRAGYVGQIGKLNTKLLYGQSYQEPTPRQLYGAWAGSGASPELTPENTQTIEAIFNYAFNKLNILVNPYYNIISDLIIDLEAGPKNHASQNIFGTDIHLHTLHQLGDNQLKLWMYYSFLKAEEEKYDAQGNKTGDGNIGDMAEHKIFFGTTFKMKKNFTATLKGRYIGEKETVDTNPIDKVDSFFTLDANLLYRNFLVKQLNLAFRVFNVFDTEYMHPGIRTANAGDTPGQWVGNQWHGSLGWTNSLLPQPGRSYLLSLSYNF